MPHVGMQHPVILPVEADLEGLVAPRAERDRELVAAAAGRLHRLRHAAGAPRADYVVALGRPRVARQEAAAAGPEGEVLAVQVWLLHDLGLVRGVPEHEVHVRAAPAAGRHPVEDAPVPVGDVLAVQERGLAQLHVGVDLPEVHGGDVRPVEDVEEDHGELEDAARLTRGAHVGLRSAKEQDLLVAPVAAAQDVRRAGDFHAVRQQAPDAVALLAVHVQRVDARVLDGRVAGLLLRGPAGRRDAGGSAVVRDAPAGDGAIAEVLRYGQLLIQSLCIGLQAHARTHLASYVAGGRRVECEAPTVVVHEGPVPCPHHRRHGEVHAATACCGAVLTGRCPSLVGVRHSFCSKPEGHRRGCHLAIDGGTRAL
mmetsp:Transcript_114901/g.336135  ORF Transcript_114901/g.336135 Transcript_114901/m.336135 type:complete len:368 (-) Transcript_114901:1440-2543(-)